MTNHPNRNRVSAHSKALRTFIAEFHLTRVSIVKDSAVCICGYIDPNGRKVITVDAGEDGWDIYVPVSSENTIAATKEALTAYLAPKVA